MLPFDVTLDTGEENEIGRKHSRVMVDKSRDNSLFQETSYFECCSEGRFVGV